MFAAGDVVTFTAWFPHSRVGRIVDRAGEDPNFWKVRCFSDERERWYHQDGLQQHIPKKKEVDPDRPWEAYQ